MRPVSHIYLSSRFLERAPKQAGMLAALAPSIVGAVDATKLPPANPTVPSWPPPAPGQQYALPIPPLPRGAALPINPAPPPQPGQTQSLPMPPMPQTKQAGPRWDKLVGALKGVGSKAAPAHVEDPTAAARMAAYLQGGGQLSQAELARAATQFPSLTANFPQLGRAVEGQAVRNMVGSGPIPGAYQGGAMNSTIQTLLGLGGGAGAAALEPTDSLSEAGQRGNLILNMTVGGMLGNPRMRQMMLKKVVKDPGTGLRSMQWNPKGIGVTTGGSAAKILGLIGADKLVGTLSNIEKGTKEIAPLIKNVNAKVDKGPDSFSKNFEKQIGRFESLAKGARPYVAGGIGGLIGNMAGQYFEDEKRVSPEEAKRQKRNRVLLTLLGGAAGAGLGSADPNTLKDNLRSGNEFVRNFAADPSAALMRAKDWAASLGSAKQANFNESVGVLQQIVNNTGMHGGASGDTAAALQELQGNPDQGFKQQLRARALGMPLGGAAAGAGIGALIQHLRGRGKRDKDKPSTGAGVVLGGLAGGLLGTAGALDAPRQSWNASAYGRGFGTVPFGAGLDALTRIITKDRPDDAVWDTITNAARAKWGPRVQL